MIVRIHITRHKPGFRQHARYAESCKILGMMITPIGKYQYPGVTNALFALLSPNTWTQARGLIVLLNMPDVRVTKEIGSFLSTHGAHLSPYVRRKLREAMLPSVLDDSETIATYKQAS